MESWFIVASVIMAIGIFLLIMRVLPKDKHWGSLFAASVVVVMIVYNTIRLVQRQRSV